LASIILGLKEVSVLVSDLVAILHLLNEEYRRHEILQLLNQAMNASSSRNPNNMAPYANIAGQVKPNALKAIKDNALLFLPLADRDFLNQSKYGPFLPSRIANLIYDGLPDDPARAMSSTEFSYYIDNVARAINELNAVLQATNSLKVERYTKEKGHIALRIEIPRDLIDNDISEIALRYTYLDDLFAAISEAKTGNIGNKPKLFTVSTSDLVTTLTSDAAEIYAILEYIIKLVEISKTVLNMKRAIANMISLNIPLAKEEGERPTQALLQLINDAVDKIMASPDMQADESRRNELKKAVKDASMKLTADLPRGLKISVDITNKIELEYFTEASGKSEADATKLIAKHEEAQIDVISLGRDTAQLLLEGNSSASPL
jgi:flagellin-specific chaperone FliS